jgi:hypothetical protein
MGVPELDVTRDDTPGRLTDGVRDTAAERVWVPHPASRVAATTEAVITFQALGTTTHSYDGYSVTAHFLL